LKQKQTTEDGMYEPDEFLEAEYEERTELPYDGCEGNWPGDGSGMDDLADFNANEADDYRDEGMDLEMDSDFGMDE